MVNMSDQASTGPTRQNAADLGEAHSGLVFENPHPVAGQSEHAP